MCVCVCVCARACVHPCVHHVNNMFLSIYRFDEFLIHSSAKKTAELIKHDLFIILCIVLSCIKLSKPKAIKLQI